MTESQLQQAVMDAWRKLGLPHTRVCAIPNARAFGQPGLTRGVPDLLVLAPGLPLGLIELKTEKGRLSQQQQDFKADCIVAGAPIAICYGLDETLSVLTDWRAIRRVQ